MNILKIATHLLLGSSLLVGGMYLHYINEPEPVRADYEYLLTKTKSSKKTDTYPIMEEVVVLSDLLSHTTEMTIHSSALEELYPRFALTLEEGEEHFTSILEMFSQHTLYPISLVRFPDGGGTYYTDGDFSPSIPFITMEITDINGPVASDYLLCSFKTDGSGEESIASLTISKSGAVVVGFYDSTVETGIQQVPYMFTDYPDVFVTEVTQYILYNEELLKTE